MSMADEMSKALPEKEKLGRIAALIDDSGIDIAEIGKIDKIRLGQHQVAIKRRLEDGTDHVEVFDLQADSLAITPTWAEGPEWPVVQQAAPTKINYGRRPKPLSDGLHRTVLLPDPQIGYWRYLDGEDAGLAAMHDEQAIAVALEVARAVRPDRMVNLGDFLDLAEFSSKFSVWPEFYQTTQPTIDRAHGFLAEQRAILGPEGELVLIAGNHDDRLSKSVLNNAKSALRLRRANTPDSWPVISVPYLLRLEELRCSYVSGYPAGSVKLADGTGQQTPLYAVHERGLDVAKVAKGQRQSYVQGHMHRVAMHSETYELDGQPVDVEAWSLGSLCRNDGFVPSTKGAPDDKGRPVSRIESWQHAVGVLTVAPDGLWSIEAVRIRDGKAIYNNKLYEAPLPEGV